MRRIWNRLRGRKTRPLAPAFVHDGVTRNRYSAYWWEPGCKCHWSAGIDDDYCDFCKAKTRVTPPGEVTE